MEKHRSTEEHILFPMGGQSLALPLQSIDKREHFILDLSRGRIDLRKVKMQTRGRQVVVLVRLDLGGAPHRNPDDVEIPVPHLHVYREGYGDRWAVPIPAERFRDLGDAWVTLDDFQRFCNITQPPHIERGLFT
jgi:extradiol dioxygenase family protein